MRKVDHITPEQRAINTERARKWRESKGKEYMDSLVAKNRERYRSDPEFRKRAIAATTRFIKQNPKPKAARITPKIWKQMKADNPVCEYCRIPFGGSIKPECDHRIPESRGGHSWRSNLAVVCRSCNAKKRTLTEDEFRRKMGYLTNGTKSCIL